jgi:DNA-binding transcriptional regulator GbsR (MarR family)
LLDIRGRPLHPTVLIRRVKGPKHAAMIALVHDRRAAQIRPPQPRRPTGLQCSMVIGVWTLRHLRVENALCNGSDMTKHSDENSSARRFIDRFGMSLEEDGMPRTAGRMIALMIVGGGPFSFSELAERLEISRGSVSTNTRFLEQRGMIERVARSGDRQDYFQATENSALRTIESWAERQVKKERIAKELLTDENLPADARQRVEEMLEFLRATTAAARDMIARLESR